MTHTIPVEVETSVTGQTARVVLDRIIELGIEAMKSKGIMADYPFDSVTTCAPYRRV